MIKALRELFDDFKDRVEGFTALDNETINKIKKELEEVEHLAMSEGAAIDIIRVVGLVRAMIRVPVSSEDAVVQKEMLEILKTIGVVATAFKQYFSSAR
jgi:hypothetical protein